jgi:hypothetical protein
MTMRNEYDANAALVAARRERGARRGAIRFRPSEYMLRIERRERAASVRVWCALAVAVVVLVVVLS